MPDFSPDGFLAPGIHDVTYDELRRNYSFSPRRQAILGSLNAYLNQCLWKQIASEVWMDGSFVENRPDPNDIDVLCFFDLANLTPAIRTEILGFQNGTSRDAVKHAYHVDMLFVPMGDVNQYMYWRGVFGFDRLDRPKGFLRVAI